MIFTHFYQQTRTAPSFPTSSLKLEAKFLTLLASHVDLNREYFYFCVLDNPIGNMFFLKNQRGGGRVGSLTVDIRFKACFLH